MKRRSECSGHASFHSFLCYCKHCKCKCIIAVTEVLSVYKQQTSSLLLYICDYTCVECATWSILAGLAHSSSWISEEKLCGKTSLLIRQKSVSKIYGHIPHATIHCQGGIYGHQIVYPLGRSKPTASLIVMLLHVLKMRMLLMDW